MNNFEFLKKYQKLQDGIMYDKLIDLGFAVVSYCSSDESEFWNNALTDQVLSDEQILTIEGKLNELDRKSTFYFENKSQLGEFTNNLIKKGYSKSFEDSWLFWNGSDVDKNHFRSTKKVETENDLRIFLKTFDRCYQKDDPQNPYGELGDYLLVAEKAWHVHHSSDRLEYFIVYNKEQPVAVSALTNFQEIGYISNVGSIRETRGEGYGKAASLFCVEKSIQNGNEIHCLATEEGHYPNEFYKRIGFKTRFTACGYTREKQVKT